MTPPAPYAAPAPQAIALPADDPLRETIHNEVHARPLARVPLPALIVFVAVLNDGVSRDDECTLLRRLPGQQGLAVESLQASFMRFDLPGGATLKWERHTEFTRYSLVQPLPAAATADALPGAAELLHSLPAGWIGDIPGRTIAAIELLLLRREPFDEAAGAAAMHGFDERDVVLSRLGDDAVAATDFRLRRDGFERLVVVCAAGVSPTRAGRISQRLLELETYRLMALRGLPVVKALAPTLRDAEVQLAAITARLEDAASSDKELLHTLTALAARVERATAEHGYRFTATAAYEALVHQRIAELNERATPGHLTIGQFMQRRLSPAMATVAATARRLADLSTRVERAGALLRTRVDIAAEAQNQQLLAKLTRGQQLQLELQTTVEGLSIAAISYYVVSLLLYGLKAAKSAGLPLNAELAAGALVPLVVWTVWRTTRRIHRSISGAH